MSQLHKRLTDEQIGAFFQSYCQGSLSRIEIQKVLEIGKTRFFALLKVFREDPQNFTVAYHRRTPARLSPQEDRHRQTAGSIDQLCPVCLVYLAYFCHSCARLCTWTIHV
jgi:hypothetical protein